MSKRLLPKKILHNHTISSLSNLDLEMIKCVPPGGNWKNIPETIPSQRLEQIRISFKQGKGSRSTYYGRLDSDKPAYTISTSFNRPGNGCFIHPKHNRLISHREAARLQSFPDNFCFLGSKTSVRSQIGNAVPVLLGYALASKFPKTTFYDLFCGAGGLSLGFILAGHKSLGGVDLNSSSIETFNHNHPNSKNLNICADLTKPKFQKIIVNGIRELLGKKELGLIVGGPPCQGFSTAGNRRSLKDPRNSLPFTFLEMVSKLKPKNFVMEEVTGLLNMEDGIVLKQILDKTSKMGYTCTHYVLKAENFGVPQKRRRLFIIGSKTGKKIEPPKPIFGDNVKNMKKIVVVNDAISDISSINPINENISLEYSNLENMSPFQKWIKGLINFKQFVKLQEKN